MGGNMQKMMKQIQKMQAEIERIQLELGNDRVEGTAGGGAVRAVADGHQSFVEIHIDPAAVIPTTLKCYRTWSWQPAMRLYASPSSWLNRRWPR